MNKYMLNNVRGTYPFKKFFDDFLNGTVPTTEPDLTNYINALYKQRARTSDSPVSFDVLVEEDLGGEDYYKALDEAIRSAIDATLRKDPPSNSLADMLAGFIDADAQEARAIEDIVADSGYDVVAISNKMKSIVEARP